MDEMFRAAAMVTVFFICLSIFHHPHLLDHELLSNTLDSNQGQHSLGLCHCLHPLLPNVPSRLQAFLEVAG